MPYWMKLAIAVAVTFLSAWIPLVGSYHYETSLATALLGLVCIPFLAPRVAESTPDDKAKTIAKCIGASILYFGSANGIYMAVAALSNQLCDVSQGIQFQLLIALPSNLLVASIIAWGQCVFKRRLWRVLLYIFVVCIDFGFVIFALYHWPPIIAFGQFIGYFAGSIYDESIDVFGRLFAYRLGTFAIIILWLYGACGRLWRQIAMPIACLCLSFGYQFYLAETGQIAPIGRGSLESALWATIDTPHYRVHYLPRSKNRQAMAREYERIANDYERDYRYLESFFQTTVSQKMEIWHYPDAEMKGHYLGAKRTSFARLWKREIHVVEGSADSTLSRHEMAHLFAASFSTSHFGVAGGWLPSLGWTEGLAMAAEWPIETYDLHAWAHGILHNEAVFGHIDPVTLMYGFWGLPSRVAYTVAGSFVRWLIERYGIEKVKQMSNLMPGDFEDAFGISFRNLFEQWRNDILHRRFAAGVVDRSRLVFASQSIWTRHCARTRAYAQMQFATCLGDNHCPNRVSDEILVGEFCTNDGNRLGDRLLGLELIYSRYIAHGAIDTGHRAAALPTPQGTIGALRPQNTANDMCSVDDVAKASASDLRHAIAQSLSQIDIAQLGPAQQISWHERTADILWHANQNTLAALYYRLLSTNDAIPEPAARRIEIKAQAAETMHSPVSQILRLWFANSLDESIAAASQAFSNAPILSYLAFVNAMNRRDFTTARQAYMRIIYHMRSAERATQLPPRAWREFWRLVGYL